MATTENESAITISTPSVIVNNESGGNNNNNNIVSNKSNLVEKSTILRIVCLVLWIFTLVLLLIAMIVLCTDSIIDHDSSEDDSSDDSLHFDDIYAYRYMLSVTVIGIIYTFVRLGLLTYQIMISTKVIKGFILLDFYGDKFISYLLATGSAAGFGLTVDMNANFSLGEFSSKGFASSALVLIAFLCTAILSVLSSYSLSKLALVTGDK